MIPPAQDIVLVVIERGGRLPDCIDACRAHTPDTIVMAQDSHESLTHLAGRVERRLEGLSGGGQRVRAAAFVVAGDTDSESNCFRSAIAERLLLAVRERRNGRARVLAGSAPASDRRTGARALVPRRMVPADAGVSAMSGAPANGVSAGRVASSCTCPGEQEGCLWLVGSRSISNDTRHLLIVLAGNLTALLHGTQIGIAVRFESDAAEDDRRSESGFRRIQSSGVAVG